MTRLFGKKQPPRSFEVHLSDNGGAIVRSINQNNFLLTFATPAELWAWVNQTFFLQMPGEGEDGGEQGGG